MQNESRPTQTLDDREPATLPTCRSCKTGQLRPSQRSKTFSPPGVGPVTVQLLQSICGHCSQHANLVSQHDENLRRLAARKESYGPHFLGEELFSFRRQYGLRQGAVEAIFGLDYGQWDLFENEAAYPAEGARKLIELAMNEPLVLQHLASSTKQRIPLFSQRHPELGCLVNPSTLLFPAT